MNFIGRSGFTVITRASVGVAMGLNGSDVAKGAADIVLADDNFSTIVRAIRKGRSVFQNLAKFLVYLLSGNVAEVRASTLHGCPSDQSELL